MAATALLALAVIGCGGRGATSPASNPAERPVTAAGASPTARPEPGAHPEPSTHPEPPTRPEPAIRPAVPAPVPAVRLDAPSRSARHDPAPQAGTPPPEVRHTLRRGQTLYSLARTYDIPLRQLLAANGISDPRSIPAGTELLIPGARVRLPYRPAAAATGRGGTGEPVDAGGTADGRADATLVAADVGGFGGDRTHAGGSGGDRAQADGDDDRDGEHHGDGVEAPGERRAVRADPADSLQWPLHGVITGAYGRRGRKGHHAGVDIDGQRGDPIMAAASGVVVSAGMDGPYGRRVAIDHGDGIVTLYAHADRLLVHTGEQVRAGQRIAEVGRSGNARGTHLHFEVRREGRAVDPLPYLRDNALLTAGVN